jgi:filamentous hemagglutinin family protein
MPIAAFAQVTPDGGTATTATRASNGHVTVNIAPVFTGVTGDISHNTYTDFNVGKAGVMLDNRQVDARTIVNEVTSSNPSRIRGPLEVLGLPAHVILANPNGITVNGGEFINTGGVALTTGRVSFIDRTVTPITTQRNVVLSTNRGTIRVEGDGIAGTLSRLELIAKKVEIDAPITNDLDLEGAAIRVVGGNSNVELDSSISVVDLTSPWSHVSAGVDVVGDDCPDAICVDITGLGSLTSSKIEIAVTEAGAGVKVSGSAASTIEDITITASGKILIDGNIQSARNNFIGERAGSGNNVTSTTDKVVIAGNGKVEALGANVITANNLVRIRNNGSVVGATNIIDAKAIELIGKDGGSSWQRPTLTSLTGANNLNASERLEIAGADVLSATNTFTRSPTFLARAVQQANGTWNDSSIASVDGGVIIETTSGDIINHGSTIQGTTRIANDFRSEGAVTLISAGRIENRSLSKDALAIVFGSEDDVVTRSVGDIYNMAGRFISNQDVVYHSTNGTLYNVIEKASVANEGELTSYNRKSGRFLFKRKRIRGQQVEFGDAAVPGETAFITAGRDVIINTKDVMNQGGEIYAQGGKITVNTRNITTEMMLSGSAYEETICSWFCKKKGGSSLDTHGGTFRALGNIEVNASGEIRNIGGAFQSVEGNLILNSPNPVIVESKPVFDLIKMDRGIFRKDFIRMLRYDQGGALVANMGRLSATSLVRLNGGYIDAKEEALEQGKEVIREPEDKPNAQSGGHIGAFDFAL